jgi:beta-lactamase class A
MLGISPRQEPDSLRELIEARVAASPGAIASISYRDPETGESLDINADSVFHAASTMKIPVMIEVFQRSQAGGFALDQGILLVNRFASVADGSDYALSAADDGDSTLYGRVGQRVAIRELMRQMITRSSNLATNELIALVGAERVTETAHRLGATRISVLRGVEDQKAFDKGMINTTTAPDLAVLLSAIESGKVLSQQSSWEMRDVLLAQEFNEKIPAGLPPGTRVAHKTGEITAVSHDAAVVYPVGRKPYVLVVLTRGIRDKTASSALIRDISRIVWTHATKDNR